MTTTPTPVPTVPGIYAGLPMDAYRRIPAYGSSFLVDLLHRAPLYARLRADQPEEPSREWTAADRGEALHALLLEPAHFGSRYIEGAACEAVLSSGPRKGQPCGAESGAFYAEGEAALFLCGTHGRGREPIRDGRRAIRSYDLAELRSMAASVMSVSDCLIGHACATEVTLVWTDEGSGLLCKARPDFICGTRIYDLKSRASPRGPWSPEAWAAQVYREGLHIQAAHYVAGAQTLGMDVEDFGWIRVEAAPPHLAQLHDPMDDDSAAFAEQERRTALATVAECVRTGKWPGYPSTGYTRLPEWALSRGEDVDLRGLPVEEEEV